MGTKPEGARLGTPDLNAPRDLSVSRAALLPDEPDVSAALRLHRQRDGLAGAMRSLMQRYAAEVRAFLRSRTSSRYSMEEVYSAFSEDVWKGLPQVRSEAPARSWIYVVARNALSRHVRSKRRFRDRHTFSGVDTAVAELRQSLVARDGQLAQLAPLLSSLNEQDRRLIERRLIEARPWREIALESAGDPSEASVTRESARLRKRFQLLIASLREQLE